MTPALAVIAIASNEVPVATRSGRPTTRMSSGTATMPPPTPKKAEKTPAASPMATRRTHVSYEHGQSGLARRDRLRRGGNRLRGGPGTHPAEGHVDVRRGARPETLPEPALRRLLGRARQRRAYALRERGGGGALLRREHRRPLRPTQHERHSRGGAGT